MLQNQETALERWYEDESNRDRLRILLLDPVLVEAFRLVLASESPMLTPADSRPDVLLAREAVFQSGIHAFPNKLRDLTRVPRREVDEPDFEYLANPDNRHE